MALTHKPHRPLLPQLAALAAGHASKFVSGGAMKKEDNVLFTEAGLHPGSPRWKPPPQPWQAGAQLQQAEGRQWGAEVGPVAAATDREAAAGPPAPGPSKPEEDGGDEFVYGQVRRRLARGELSNACSNGGMCG